MNIITMLRISLIYSTLIIVVAAIMVTTKRDLLKCGCFGKSC